MVAAGRWPFRLFLALLVGLYVVAAEHEITTDAVVGSDGTVEIARHRSARANSSGSAHSLNASATSNEEIPDEDTVSVEVTPDGSQKIAHVKTSRVHAHHDAAAASVDGPSVKKPKVELVRSARAADIGDASSPSSRDDADEEPSGSSQVIRSASSTDVERVSQAPVSVEPHTAQVVVGVLLPEVELGIEKYAALNDGKCPEKMPAVPGWDVKSPYGYGAGCKVKLCMCPSLIEECADGARFTGTQIGSGITTTSTQLLGYCRTKTWVIGAPTVIIAGVGLGIAYRHGLASHFPWNR